MQELNNMSVEELVQSYNNQNICKVNIRIYEGRNTRYHLIKSIIKTKETLNIKFDPNRELSFRDYSDAYYCNNKKDLLELITYLVNESLHTNTENSEDVLDQFDTIHIDYTEL